MFSRKIDPDILSPELKILTSRSGGPGGQNVNKVNSKVTVQFDIPGSRILTDEEKHFLLEKLAPRLTGEGIVTLTSQHHRSQLENKQEVFKKLGQLLARAYAPKKLRRATKPSKASKQVRLKKKKVVSEKKKWRKKPDL